MRIHMPSLLIGAALGVIAIVAVGSTGVGARPAEAQADALAAAQKAQVMSVTYQLDTSGFHELDDKLNAGEFVSGALGRVRRARIAAQNTIWPHDLEATSTSLVQKMTELEGALRDENVAMAAPLAKDVHDMAHDLSNDVYQWLTGAVPSQHGH